MLTETTTATPQEQSKTETTALSGLDRLSQDPDFLLAGDNKTTTTEAPKTETKTATQETAELEGEKTEVKVDTTTDKQEETKTETTTTTETTETEDIGFKDDTTNAIVSEQGTWKAYLEANDYPIPEDFTEEKGFEIVLETERQRLAAEYEQKAQINRENVFEVLPEQTRSEAKLIFDLMAQGNTLEQIIAPIQSINELRSLSPEQLIRKNLEGMEGWTPDMVEHEMEKITANGHVDIEHKKLMLFLDQSEKQINAQRQQQIDFYNNQQNQIREQKRQQELGTFKTVLDRMPTFMDRKLSDDNKRTILNEYNNGAVEQLLKNPEKIAKFMLWDKYGEQGLKYIQARAQEQATLQKAKDLHNIPQNLASGGGQNRVSTTTTTQFSSGIDRVSNDPQFK